DPIAPTPDMRFAVANLVAAAPARPIAVTPDIHPVPSPALPVARVVQQAVNDLFVGVTRLVAFKRRQLFRRWRETDQIEINAAQKNFLRRFWSVFQFSLVLFPGNESVDWIANPCLVFDPRHWRVFDRFKRLPTIRRQIFFKFGVALFGFGQFLFVWGILGIARIMTEQNFGFVTDAVAVAVFPGDDFQTRCDVRVLSLSAQLFSQQSQSIPERIVR